MADFPLHGGQRYATSSAPGVPGGLTITANASTNTKGSYTALQTAAGNTIHSSGVLLTMLNSNSAPAGYLIDIALGAAGSEQVVAANLLYAASNALPASYWLPIAIPQGQRIAARCQCTTGSATVQVTATFMQQGFLPSAPLGRVASYGLNTGTSRGTSVDPGAVSKTEGAWTQITAATTSDHSYLLVAAGDQQNAAPSAGGWLLDIGLGAAASEVEVISDLPMNSGGTPLYGPMTFPPLPLEVPAGTAISARLLSDVTDATDRLRDIAIYGIG